MKIWIVALGLATIAAIIGVGILVTFKSPSLVAVTVINTVSSPPASITEPTPSTNTGSRALTVTAVGDIMLDRYVRESVQKNGSTFPFAKIQSELNGHIVVGNLEGPFTEQPSVATNEHLIFTFDPALAPTLKEVGFTVLSLANNHTLNFGQAGLESTRQILATASIQSFGDPANQHGFGLVQEVGGRKIAWLGYHGLVTGRDTIIEDIREAKAAGLFVIVMAHWGIEYQLAPATKQIADAHALIDAGADLIIGAHPHVVQPFEIYQGKFIAYSLGNFLFDQYFSVDTTQGLMLHLTFDDSVVGIEFVPLVMIAGQVTRLTGASRDTLLERLASGSILTAEQQNHIRQGRLTLPYVQPTN